MLKKGPSVLLVDRDASIRRAWARALLDAGFEVLTAQDARVARGLIGTARPAVVVVDAACWPDIGLGGRMDDAGPSPVTEPVVMLAVDAGPMAIPHGGVFAVVERGPVPASLALLVSSAHAYAVACASARASAREPTSELVAASSITRKLVAQAAAVADASTPVLVIGETGVGRRALLRHVHANGKRRTAALEIVACDAVAPASLGAELATALSRAAGGSVLVHRVDLLPPGPQQELADWLARPQPPAAPRVLATAEPSIRRELKEGRFLAALYYRLAVTLLDVPPLRQRKDDISVLAAVLLRGIAQRLGTDLPKLTLEAARRLRRAPWPGNVPELESALHRAAANARGGIIVPGDLDVGNADGDEGDDESLRLTVPLGDASLSDVRQRATLAVEKAYVERIVAHAGGNVSQAARLAGMDRANFRRLMRRVGVAGKRRDPPSLDEP